MMSKKLYKWQTEENKSLAENKSLKLLYNGISCQIVIRESPMLNSELVPPTEVQLHYAANRDVN